MSFSLLQCPIIKKFSKLSFKFQIPSFNIGKITKISGTNFTFLKNENLADEIISREYLSRALYQGKCYVIIKILIYC